MGSHTSTCLERSGCGCHRFLRKTFPVALSNVSQDEHLLANDRQTLYRANCKELRMEEDNVVVVVRSGPMISPSQKSVQFAHAFTQFVMKREVEADEVERPPGLATVELLGSSEIFEVLVVGPDLEQVSCAFEEVAPLL
ncbi:hypothetical protein H0H92_007628 [Tricholoma furcatifolium]|nr:hypothetical protein H0H92_007628 [Tricholoma furcatifolium]